MYQKDTHTYTHTDVLSFSSSIVNPVLSLCVWEKKKHDPICTQPLLSLLPPSSLISLALPPPLFLQPFLPPFCLIWAIMKEQKP